MLAFSEGGGRASEGGGRVSDTAVLQVLAGVTNESVYQICYFLLADLLRASCLIFLSLSLSLSLLLFPSLILRTALPRLCHIT